MICLCQRLFNYFSQPVKIDGTLEAKLVVQALRINTLSKLTFSDSARFDGLVQDVFPGIEFKDIEYETLGAAFREVCAENNLLVNENQVGLHARNYASVLSFFY